ncbi:NUCLEAR LIM INTERACTOR-INTERACTING FACTOR-RELATED [Salix viminalis]|uniref:Mitochondrial import inner membrane translocase subunit TIM50 n=1 Tax=Salix viminalis TaxID=40686 RepID=A0A9Q0NY54_SALVM|nr:NUCLEAR LIM INTERACTOR-INTERACTING FACTOR-RELATED [Salix viminalis]
MPMQNSPLNPVPSKPLLQYRRKKKKRDEEASVKEVKIPDVCTLEQPRIRRVTKKLLILDVNGLLADIVSNVSVGYQANLVVSGKSVFKRPFCDDFLRFCFQKFDVGVWSSRTKRNLNPLIDFLFGDSRHKLLFCWDQSHCTDTGFTTVENTSKPMFLKELKKIWEYLESTPHLNKGEYDESNTLLLDDSPYKALCNPVHTAIFPQSYRYRDGADSSLGPDGDFRLYLERLAEAQNVQQYISQHPFGQRTITESNPSWRFYTRILQVLARTNPQKACTGTDSKA